MKSVAKLMLVPMIVLVCMACGEQSKTNKLSRKQEIEAFMNNYADLLRAQDMAGIGNLYFENDIVMSGHGRYEVLMLDSVKARYVRSGGEPTRFRWDRTRIELLGDSAALVTAGFYWNDDGPASYTGVFLKTKQGWKIKHEHESFSCK